MSEVAVHVVAVVDLTDADWAVLDQRERDRAERRADPRPFVVAHAALRRLAAAQLGADPQELPMASRCRRCGSSRHGQPVVVGSPSVHLSLSYTAHVAVAAATEAGPIGVDVEHLAAVNFPGFASVTLAEAEREAFAHRSGRDLLADRALVWARKEAILKAAGHGLVIDPTRVVVSGPAEPARLVHWDWPEPIEPVPVLADLVLADLDHAAAVALLAPGPIDLTRLPRTGGAPTR